VYSLKGTGIIVGGDRAGGYLVEAVHIVRPAERAYRHYEDLASMRDGTLTNYVDQKLELFGEDKEEFQPRKSLKKNKKKDKQIGQAELIKSCKFTMAPADFAKQ
jgi:hypothetical protein